MVFAVFALSICSIVPVVLLLQLAWRTFLLARLPRLPPGAKLTRELLHSAARDFAPLVRLPGSHGVLVTDPTLARKLLEGGSGAVRDVSAYAKYATFLEDALVLLPQGDGGRHARLRAQLLPLFSARRAHPTLVACVERCLVRLDEHARSSRAVPLYKELQDFTIDATSSSFLAGRLSDADGRRLKLLFEEWLDSPPEPPPPPPPPPPPLRPSSIIAAVRRWRGRCRWLLLRALSSSSSRLPPPPEEEQQPAASAPPPDRLMVAYGQIVDRCVERQVEHELRRATQCVAASAAATSDDGGSRSGEGGGLLPCVLGVLRPDDVTSAEARRAAAQQSAGLLFAGLNAAKELHGLLHLVAHQPELQAAARREVEAQLGRRGATAAAAGSEAAAEVEAAKAKVGLEAAKVKVEADATAEPPLPFEAFYGGVDAGGGGGGPRLALCDRLVRESLRLAPGIEHLRLRVAARGGARVGGHLLPPGTRLVVSPALMHRHPRHWPQPAEPDTPRPELFEPAASAARPAGCWLPFSAGPKGCPAGAFALHEMRLLLAMALRRFELQPHPGGKGVRLVRLGVGSSSS